MALSSIIDAPAFVASELYKTAAHDRYWPQVNKLLTTNINRQQGLKSGQVHSVVEGHDGRIWMSGPCGLACYDGIRVICFGVPEGLTSHGLRGLYASADGVIWVGSDGAVDRIEHDGRITGFPDGVAWAFGPAEHFASTIDGTVYVGTPTGLVYRNLNQSFRRVEHGQLGRDVIFDLAVNATGALVVASAHAGISIFDDGKWATLSPILYAAVGAVKQVEIDAHGVVFIAGDNGLIGISKEDVMLGRPRALLINVPVSKLLLYRDELWLAHANTLRQFRVESGAWQRRGEVELGTSINHIAADSFGNIWCSTDSLGCFRISALRDCVMQPELGNIGQVYSVIPGKRDSMLVGAENAILRMRTHEGRFRVEHTLDSSRAWDVLEDDDGAIWAATHFDGLLRWPGDAGADAKPERIGQGHAVLDAPGRVLAHFANGLWVGTLRGLACIRHGHVDELKGIDGASLGYVYTLVADGNRLWVGTLGNGLWVYEDPRGLSRVTGEGLQAGGNTYSVALGEDGVRAILQDNRVIRLDDHAPAQLMFESPELVVGWTALLPNANTLVIGGGQGLVEYDFTDMKVRREIRCGGIGGHRWEFTSSRALALDADNRYWCGLNSGVTVVDHTELEQYRSQPDVLLLDVEWFNASPTLRGQRHTLPAGKWHGTVRFFASSQIDDDNTLFRHKLIGFDDKWSALSREASLSFTSLPVGNYFVEVQAWSPLSGYGRARLLAEITVKGEGAFAEAVDGLAGGIIRASRMVSKRVRNQYLLRANQELSESLRAQAQETTNANKALVLANERLKTMLRVDALTGIANRRAFDEALTREWKRAIRERTPIAILMIDIDFFKLINDLRGHVHGDNCLKLVAHCLDEVVRDDIDTCARYGGEEFGVILPNTRTEGAMNLAERLREAVAMLQLEHPKSLVAKVVTVSIGVVTMLPVATDAAEVALKLADDALYQAKGAGRNQVRASVHSLTSGVRDATVAQRHVDTAALDGG